MYYWPASQNLGMPGPKTLSCKPFAFDFLQSVSSSQLSSTEILSLLNSVKVKKKQKTNRVSQQALRQQNSIRA